MKALTVYGKGDKFTDYTYMEDEEINQLPENSVECSEILVKVDEYKGNFNWLKHISNRVSLNGSYKKIIAVLNELRPKIINLTEISINIEGRIGLGESITVPEAKSVIECVNGMDIEYLNLPRLVVNGIEILDVDVSKDFGIFIDRIEGGKLILDGTGTFIFSGSHKFIHDISYVASMIGVKPNSNITVSVHDTDVTVDLLYTEDLPDGFDEDYEELTDAEVLKWREHIIDLFLQMLDRGEIEPLKNGAWDTDVMGSGCFSYYSLDNADSANEDIFLHINDTVNFPDPFDDDSIKDVYIALASVDGSVDVPQEYWNVRFNVPTSDENIKATIKKVYEFFRNSKDPEEFYNFDKLPDLDESADDLKALDNVLSKPVRLRLTKDGVVIINNSNNVLDSFAYNEVLENPIVQHEFKIDTLYVDRNVVVPDFSIFDHLTIEPDSFVQFPVDFDIEEVFDRIGEKQISKKWEVEVINNVGHARVDELQKVIDILGKYNLSFSAPLFDSFGDEELVIDTPYGHDFFIDMCVPEKPESSGSLTLKGNGTVWICNDEMDLVEVRIAPTSDIKVIVDNKDVTYDYTYYDGLPDMDESLLDRLHRLTEDKVSFRSVNISDNLIFCEQGKYSNQSTPYEEAKKLLDGAYVEEYLTFSGKRYDLLDNLTFTKNGALTLGELATPITFAEIQEVIKRVKCESLLGLWIRCINASELQKVLDEYVNKDFAGQFSIVTLIADVETDLKVDTNTDVYIDEIKNSISYIPDKSVRVLTWDINTTGTMRFGFNGKFYGTDYIKLSPNCKGDIRIVGQEIEDFIDYDLLPDFDESLNEDISWNGLADSIRSGLKHGERNGTDGTIKWVLTTSLDDCWDNMTEDMKEFLLDEIDTNISTDLKVFKRTERDNKLTDIFTFTFEGSVDEVSAKYGIAKEHIEPSNKEGIVRLPFSFELTVDEYGALPDLDEDYKLTDRDDFGDYAFYNLVPVIKKDLESDKHEGDCKGCMWKVTTLYDDVWNELADLARVAIDKSIANGVCAIFDVYYDDTDRLLKEFDGKKCHERRVWLSNSNLDKTEEDVRATYNLPDEIKVHYDLKGGDTKCYYIYVDYKFELIPYDVENMPLPDFDESFEEPRIGRVLLGKDNRKIVQDAMTQAPLHLELDGLEVIALVVKAENVDDDIIANINKLANVERTCIFELCDLRGFDFSLLDRFDFQYLTLKYCIVDENLANFINDRNGIVCLENCTILKGTVFENARDVVIKNCLGDLEIGSGAENLQFIDEGGLNLVLNLNSGLEFIDYNYDDYDLTEFYAEHPEYFKDLPDLDESVDDFYHDLYSRIVTRIKRGERDGVVDSTKWKLKTSIDKYWDSISDEITGRAIKVIANNIQNRNIGVTDWVMNGGVTIPFASNLSADEVSKKFNIPINLLTDYIGLNLPIEYALVLEPYGALPDLDESLNESGNTNRTLVVEDGYFQFRDYFDDNWQEWTWDDFKENNSDIFYTGKLMINTLMIKSAKIPDLSFIKDNEVNYLYIYSTADLNEVATKLSNLKVDNVHVVGEISQDIQKFLDRRIEEITFEQTKFNGEVKLNLDTDVFWLSGMAKDNTGSLVIDGTARVSMIYSMDYPVKFSPNYKGKIEYVFGSADGKAIENVDELMLINSDLVYIKDYDDEFGDE